MKSFANMPIERKLRLAMVLTSTVALLLACVVILTVEYRGYRSTLAQTIRTVAQLTAQNSTASLAFEDMESGRQILNALSAEPQIVTAVLTDATGEAFVTYREWDLREVPEAAELPEGIHFRAGRAIVVEPVVEGERTLGWLRMQVSLAEMRQRLRNFSIIIGFVLLAAVAVSWILASFLRRGLARPILELSRTAASITDREDWSLRARHYGDDELGRLTQAFNKMLERTQEAVTALRENEAQLRLVTDNAPVFLSRLDRNLRYLFMNAPLAEHLGITSGTCRGRHLKELISEEELETIRPHLEEALRGETVQYELSVDRWPRARGRRWLQCHYVPDLGPKGEVVGLVAVISDITERKRSEEQVARARDEAIAASRAKDDFLASLSHELRTPLNPVLLLASEAVEDKTLPKHVRSDFETIRHNVELEARLIDDLLDLTRISRGKLVLTRECLDLREIIDTALVSVRPEVEDKRLSVQLDLGSEQYYTVGDGARLAQIFWNVLRNAVKFTPEGGLIAVETEALGEEKIRVRVKDSGIGMTPAELSRVFDAFAQGDHAAVGGSHRFGGLGLGLALARMLVTLHGGDIRASSGGLGKGSTVTIELPAASREAARKVQRETARQTDAPSEELPRPRSFRILLVEDHGPTRQALQMLLSRRGHEVTAAGSATEALAKAEGERFDLLVTDIGLPDRDGYSIMQELHARHQGLTGIALSGYGMEEDIARSRDAGFSAHLIKPVNAGDLDRTIAEVLG